MPRRFRWEIAASGLVAFDVFSASLSRWRADNPCEIVAQWGVTLTGPARRMLLTLLMVASVQSQAVAADIQGLADYVRPAYLAMNIAAICARTDPFFLHDTSGPRGTPLHYAQHVKDEAIERLTQQDAIAVLKLAADAARNDARAMLKERTQPGDDIGTARAIKNWCDTDAKRTVLDFISSHDDTHSAKEQFLKQAKRG